jgi:ketol-acid reductoisomerase
VTESAAAALPVFYDADLAPQLLGRRVVGIFGYGNQGHAHALNLRDSGVDVIVAVPPKSATKGAAEEAGFSVKTPSEVARAADVLMILAPDELHEKLFEHDIRPHVKPGAAVGFAHGFSVHYKQVQPPNEIDVFLAAPKGAGRLLRKEYERGGGLPSLISVHQDATGHAREIALGYAQAIGSGRAGIIETTFREECETDLFGEQAVLCGGVSALITSGFETLVEAGYPAELAYFECLHELKFTVDLIHERGIAGMRGGISSTAKYGDTTRGPRIIDASVKARMKEILEEITSGRFASEWILENQVNRPVLTTLLKRGAEHPIEAIGARLRKMMPWLKKS